MRASEYKFLPTEEEEQTMLFSWASMQKHTYPELELLFHIPNEGKRTAQTGARLKAAGLSSGVPDICLPVARCGYHALFIELKRQKGGTLSKNQKEWLGKLLKAGNLAVRCNGFDEAKNVLTKYIKGKIYEPSTIGKSKISEKGCRKVQAAD